MSLLSVTTEKLSLLLRALMMYLLCMVIERNIGNINQDTNAGYVRRMRMVRKADVVRVYDPVRYRLPLGELGIPAMGVQVVLGAEVYVPQVMPRTVRILELAVDTEQGTHYETSLALELPKPDSTLLTWMHRQERHEWVLIWEDYNGTAWVTGNEETGLRLGRGRSVANLNVLNFTLSGRLPLPSFELLGYELNQVFEGMGDEFSEDFSNDFNA